MPALDLNWPEGGAGTLHAAIGQKIVHQLACLAAETLHHGLKSFSLWAAKRGCLHFSANWVDGNILGFAVGHAGIEKLPFRFKERERKVRKEKHGAPLQRAKRT